MRIAQAQRKAGPDGISRGAWKADDTRAVLIGRRWMVVEDDDGIASYELKLSDDDREALDWFPLTGTEWPMAKNVKAP